MNTEITASRFQLPAASVDALRGALAPAYRAPAPAAPAPTDAPAHTSSRVRFGDPRDGHFTESTRGSFASLGACLAAARVDFAVEAAPLFTADGRAVDGWRASRRADGSEVFGVVSDAYPVIGPVDALGALLGPAIAAGVAHPTRAGHIIGRSFAQAALGLKHAEILPGDQVSPLLTAIHSYDAKSASRGGLTVTRIVCQNTMMHAFKDLGTTGLSVTKRGTPEAVAARLAEVGGTLNKIAEIYTCTVFAWRALAGRDATDADLRNLIERCFRLSSDKAGRDKLDKLHREIREIREGGRGSQIPGVQRSAWGAMNAISEYYEHEAPTRAGGASDADRRTARALLSDGASTRLEILQLEALRTLPGVTEAAARGVLRGDRAAIGLAADWQP